MSFSTASAETGLLSPDQALRLLDLAVEGASSYDLSAVIEKDGSPIAGESPRKFGHGKPHLDIEGYLWGVSQNTGVHTLGKQPHTLYLVRRTDAATASILSVLTSASEKVKVTLGVYEASGSADVDPMLEVVVDQARLVVHCIMTGGALRGPCELLGFAGRKFEVRSAPQQASGLRGAVRTCAFEAHAS